MRVHSLTILHYGADYLTYALRSVYDAVDQLHIFYTPTPSHGHQTDIPPVETKQELMQAGYAYDSHKKIKWYDMSGITHEGPQRDLALQIVRKAGADLVLVVDCDEIWQPRQAEKLIRDVWDINRNRTYCVNMIHFWRSFNWVCRDDGWPARCVDLRQGQGNDVYVDRSLVQPYHFGYAVRDEIVNYKWKIHGHKNEMRPDWLENVWSAWPPPDNCHPTNSRDQNGKAFWSPEPFDKSQLPEFMRVHPFWDREMIE